MNTISLLFSTSGHPMSAAIRLGTWSDWSHVAIIDGGEVIEATAPAGVRRFPVVQAINHAKRGAIVELPCRDPQAVIAAAAWTKPANCKSVLVQVLGAGTSGGYCRRAIPLVRWDEYPDG